MGFKYDPSIAGSSVRFDPPDPKDPPITFHKPHPDSTIQPIMLREFSKRLRKQYGWQKSADEPIHQHLDPSETDTQGLAPMKWDHFVQLMTEMGFKYDPSTAGSSVRFDPPDPKDPPITFHKPHPDSTIHPIMLKEFSKRLRKQYGWQESELLKSRR
ncbi:hypothetical protein PILCRDRAFT_819635 [Piloderma croceum F 1598]|uniref:Type II toxin-antitoxin system HicA family toxin n=1 Tax=Piloderma croceum (strain F 1598) TaxID=765440 RepID=A0A0C3C1B9_PILCF|nr:hypothetical protein PILCRDRAFT_819635 [Piloderma croceum F 1598]